MFTRPRKARVLFGLSDIILAALAFEAAYRTRVVLHLEHTFYLTVERKALVLGFALVAWVASRIEQAFYAIFRYPSCSPVSVPCLR
jgi:hypothetical protein